jgi:hypothetical protein
LYLKAEERINLDKLRALYETFSLEVDKLFYNAAVDIAWEYELRASNLLPLGEAESMDRITMYLIYKVVNTMEQNMQIQKPALPDVYQIRRTLENKANSTHTFILNDQLLLMYGIQPNTIPQDYRRILEPVVKYLSYYSFYPHLFI